MTAIHYAEDNPEGIYQGERMNENRLHWNLSARKNVIQLSLLNYFLNGFSFFYNLLQVQKKRKSPSIQLVFIFSRTNKDVKLFKTKYSILKTAWRFVNY